VGVLASTGTIKTRIYHRSLGEYGVEALSPREAMIDELMASILLFKDRGTIDPLREVLHAASEELIRDGAEGIVLGCTELPFALGDGKSSVLYFDTIEILAKAVVREATE
jgi:aspartate racemase